MDEWHEKFIQVYEFVNEEGKIVAAVYFLTQKHIDKEFQGNDNKKGGFARGLVEAAEKTLDVTPEKRQRTLLRIDAGVGSVDDIN